MGRIKITSHRNNSPLSGWAGIGLGGLCFALSFCNQDAPQAKFALLILAGMFLAIGCGILIWFPRRIIIVDPTIGEIQIEDLSRFGKKIRILPFDEIAEIVMQEWVDPDPDIRPFKRVLYWLALRLHSGEEVEITDQTPGKEDVSELRGKLANCLKTNTDGR